MNNSTFNLENPESSQYINNVINRALHATEYEVLENDHVSLAHRKLINSTYSADAKRAIVKERMLQKTLNMDGFEEQEVEMVDKDSGFIIKRDESGNIISRTPIRLQAYGHYDGVDELKNIKKSAYKQANQPKFVSMLTGKPEHALTEYDYANVKAYETAEAYNTMTYTGKGMYQSARYNPSIDYTADKTLKSAKVMVRLSGKDRYNRNLAEVVNPSNGRDIGFDFANDPYTNASFDLYKSIDTKANRAGVEAKYRRYDVTAISKAIQEKYDSDIDGTILGRLGEDLDMAQASAYRMFARLAQYGPSAIMDTDYWARVADEATGQQLADSWAGVNPKTRRVAATEMSKSIDYWKQGDYFKAILQVGSQLDRILADSAAQTISTIAVGAITGGIGLAAGASTATASTIAMVSGGVTAAVDNTLNTMEQFEANNSRKMSGEEAASTFAGFLVWAVPEVWLTTLGVGKLMPKALSSSLSKAYKDGAKMTAGKLVATSALGEAGQEFLESGWESYKSQNQAEAQSLSDVYTSAENAIATISGMFMGGALSSVPAAVKLPFESRKEKATQERVDAQNQHDASHTLAGTTNVNNDMSDLVIQSAKEFANADYTSAEELATKFNNLRASMSAPGISQAAVKAANRAVYQQFAHRMDTAADPVAEAEAFAKITGQTVEDLFNETVFYSDYNVEQVFADTGKQVTPEHATKTREELEAFGKKIGLSEEVIKKALEEVVYDVRHGSAGYQTYAQNLKNAIEQLNEAEAKGYTEDQKLEIVSTIMAQVGNLQRMLRISGKKIIAFTDAFNRYTESKGDEKKSGVRYSAQDKDDFLLRTDELADLNGSSRRDVRGMYRFLEALEVEHNDVKKLLGEIPTEILSLYNKIEQSVNETEEANTQMEASLDEMRKAFKAAATTARDKKLVEAASKRKSPMNTHYAKANAYQLAKGIANTKHKASTLTSLRLLSSTELEAVKKDLERENTPYTTKAIEFIEQAIEDVLEVEALRESRKNTGTNNNLPATTTGNLPATTTQDSNVPAVTSSEPSSNVPAATPSSSTPVVTEQKPAEPASTPPTEQSTGSKKPADKKPAVKKKTVYSEETKARYKKLLAAVNSKDFSNGKQLSLVASKYDQLIQEYSTLSDDEFNELVNYVAKSRAKNKALVVKAMEEIRQKRSANQVPSTPVTPNVEPKKDDTKKGDDTKTDEKGKDGKDDDVDGKPKQTVTYTPSLVKKLTDAIETKFGRNANSVVKAYRDLYKAVLNQFNNAASDKKQMYVSSINTLIKSFEAYGAKYSRDSETLYKEFTQTQHDEAEYIVKSCEQYAKSIDMTNSESIVSAINMLSDSLQDLITLKGVKLKKYALRITKELKRLNIELAKIFTERDLVDLVQNVDTTNDIYMQEMLNEYYNAVASLDLNVLDKETIEAIKKPILAWKKADKRYADKCNSILALTRNYTNEIKEILADLEAKDELINDTKSSVTAMYEIIHYGSIDKDAYSILDIDGASTNERSAINNVEKLIKEEAKSDENVDAFTDAAKAALLDFNTKLEHTFRVRNNAACILATEGETEQLVNSANYTAWKRRITKAIEDIAYALPTNGRASSFLKYDLAKAPHFRLLYNIKERKKLVGKDKQLASTLEFERNELVWQIVALSAEEYISQMDIASILDPQSKQDVCSAFGYNEERVTREELRETYQIIADHGVPDRFLAENLGNLIMENLGLTGNTTDDLCILGEYERIRSGLGAVAIQYLRSIGVLDFDSFLFTTPNGDQRTVNSVKFVESQSATAQQAAVLGTDKVVHNVRNQLLGAASKLTGVRAGGLLQVLKTQESSFVKAPKTKPSKRLKSIYIRKTDNLVEIAAPKQAIMNKLQQQAFYIDHSLIDDLAEAVGEDLDGLRNLLVKRLGYVSEDSEQFRRLTLEDQLSQRGRNADVTKQVDVLLKWHKQLREEPTGLYFDYFESRNNRLFIDSNDLNPQNGKHLQRFLVVNENSTLLFDSSVKEHIEQEAFAIAQAFDSVKDDTYIYALGRVVNKLSENPEWLVQLQNDLVHLDAAQFKTKYADLGVDTETGKSVGFGGIENFGQCLSTIMHLKRKQAAKGSTFYTSLTIENDSTTSGYAIRLTQIPVPELIRIYGIKVGLITQQDLDNGITKDTMHVQKRREGFDDIYKTTAKNAIAEVNKLKPDDLIAYANREYEDKYDDEKASDSAVYVAARRAHAMRFFKTLLPALPQLSPDGKVSSALRNLMKPPTMTFGYTAGIRSIKRVIAEEVMYQHFAYYQEVMWYGSGKDSLDERLEKFFAEKSKTTTIAEETKAELTAICKAVEYLNNNYQISSYSGAYYPSLFAAFDSDYYSNIRLTPKKNDAIQFGRKGDSLRLTDMYLYAVGETYGQAVWDVMSRDFAKYQEINELMNTSGVIMAQMYSDVYKAEMSKLNQKYNGRIPVHVYKELLQRLVPLLPTVPLLYDDRPNAGTPLVKFENAPAKDYPVVNPVKEVRGHTVINPTRRSYDARMKVPTDAGQAGAVVPIHAQDGTIMALTADKYPNILAIHDAIQVPACDSIEPTKFMNMCTARCGQSFNLLEAMANRVVQVANAYDQYRRDNDLHDLAKSRDLLVPALKPDLTVHLTDMLSSMLKEFNNEADMIGYQDIDDETNIAGTAKSIFKSVLQKDYAISETNNNPELTGTYTASWTKQTLDLTGLVYGETDEQSKHYIPFERVLMAFAAVVATNNKWRDEFYSQLRYVTNVDGPKGSGYEFGSTFQQDVYPQLFKSDPETFVPNEKLTRVLQEANTSTEERVNLLDYLQTLDRDSNGNVLDDEHLEHLKNVIRAINPDNIKAVQVELQEGTTRNIGKFDTTNNTISLGVRTEALDAKTRLAPLYGRSSAEIYAHELKHAAIWYASAVAKVFNADKHFNAIADLMIEAGKHITWQVFMPENVPVGMEAAFEEQARALYDHMFNNPDTAKNMAGVHEFATFGLTNKPFMDALKKIEVPVARDKTGKVKLLDRLISIVLALFDLVFANKSSREEAKQTLKKVWQGAESIRKSRTLYEELVRLDTKISGLNHKTVNKLAKHPARLIETIANLLHKIVTKTNKGLIPVLNYIFNIADKLPIKLKDAPTEFRSGWHKLGYGITALMLMMFSKKYRQGLKLLLQQIASVNHSVDLALLLKDVSEPDMALSRLEFLSMKQRNAEQSSKDAEAAIANTLLEAFGRPLNDMEATALTDVVLRTDLQALYTGNNVTEVHKLLTDENYLQEKTSKLENLISERIKELKEQKLTVPSITWIKNQAKSLAYYQLTGNGNEALCTNATLILSKGTNATTVDDYLETLVDSLASCYALQMTEVSDKKLISTLNIKGLERTMIAHKEWIKSSLEGVLVRQPDKAEGVYVKTKYKKTLDKGYVKSMLDDFYGMHLDFVDNAKQLSNEGYILVEELPHTKSTTAKPMAVYRRSFTEPKRRLGATFALRGVEAIATDLKSAAISAANHDDTDVNITDERFRRNVQVVHDRYAKLMDTKELSIEEIKRMSGGFIPCINRETLEDDFKVSIPKDIKAKHFGMDTNGIHVLSAMYAQQNTNAYGKVRNEVVLQYLYMMQETDMTSAHRSKDGMYNYVKLEPNGKFLTKVWNQVPIEVLNAISKKPLWVREDWLPYIFGVEKLSVSNVGFLQNKQTKGLRYALVVSEHILQAVAQLAKQNIVMRIPAVLIGNVISNFNYSVLQGHNPVKVVRKQLENAAAIRNYVEDKRNLTRLETRKRLGIATAQEIKNIPLYKAKLKNNKVHPLMEKGMYQSIVEDMSPEDIAANGKFTKAVKRMGIDKKMPPILKNVLRHLYMAEGTPIYDLIFQATQYSDFVARATEYQLQMEKMEAKIDKHKQRNQWFAEEQRITANVVNAFVNYDKPQAPLLEYANSLGLFMFTKFGLRMQPVIFKTVLDNPGRAVMFLASQHVLWDSDDILEQNFVSKSLSSLTHTPLENLINVSVPMAMQFATGMRSAF